MENYMPEISNSMFSKYKAHIDVNWRATQFLEICDFSALSLIAKNIIQSATSSYINLPLSFPDLLFLIVVKNGNFGCSNGLYCDEHTGGSYLPISLQVI